MNRRMRVVIGVMMGLTLVGGVTAVSLRRASSGDRAGARHATYYCPMHPSYTSDRPGDCPICSMRLVKREDAAAETGRSHGAAQTAKDICYVHNCPMAHQGKPCPMLVIAKEGERVTCPICGTHVAEAATAAPAKKILYWTDPMIPGYKSDKPGKSPMGMELVPVYEEEEAAQTSAAAAEGYAPVLISPQKQQLIGVRTQPVERRSLMKTIRTAGRIAYDPELYQAEQEYLQALTTLMKATVSDSGELRQQAERLVESSRTRLWLLGLSEELINEMVAWEGPDRRLLGTDPTGEVWLYAPVYEFELPLARAGQTVEVESAAIPGKRLSGVIRAIDPVLNPATRAARVRAVLADPDRVLKPEMFVNASIRVDLGEVLAIPEEAVFDTGTKQMVFIDKGQGLFEPRDVSLGAKADDSYEITAGVAEGERVVTSGNFLIDSESRLKAAAQGTAAGGAHQHGQ